MQPTSLYQWTRLSGTTAGTTTIATTSGGLKSIVMGDNAEGTVTFYDSSSGTSSATEIFAINNNVGSIPTALDVNVNFKSGLVAVTSGTTDMTVMWS